MGDLNGNRFTIVLRNLSMNTLSGPEDVLRPMDQKVDKAVHNLKHNGFINYFGLQRFGNMFFPKTSDVGLAMVKQGKH